MKVELGNGMPVTFKPVAITLICETPDELRYIKDCYNPGIAMSDIKVPDSMVKDYTFSAVYGDIKDL